MSVRKGHYQVKGDPHPKPPKKVFDFAISEFAGMLCPICEKTRLAASNQFPICNACQEKYIGKDIEGYRILDEIEAKIIAKNAQTHLRRRILIVSLAGAVLSAGTIAYIIGKRRRKTNFDNLKKGEIQ